MKPADLVVVVGLRLPGQVPGLEGLSDGSILLGKLTDELMDLLYVHGSLPGPVGEVHHLSTHAGHHGSTGYILRIKFRELLGERQRSASQHVHCRCNDLRRGVERSQQRIEGHEIIALGLQRVIRHF